MKDLRQRFEEYFTGNLNKNYQTDLRDFEGEPYYLSPNARIAWEAWVMSDAHNQNDLCEAYTKELDELGTRNYKLRLQNIQLKTHIAALKDALNQLQESSEGVAGLHLNGDVAPWDELREGGRFEEWLMVFDEELEVDL